MLILLMGRPAVANLEVVVLSVVEEFALEEQGPCAMKLEAGYRGSDFHHNQAWLSWVADRASAVCHLLCGRVSAFSLSPHTTQRRYIPSSPCCRSP